MTSILLLLQLVIAFYIALNLPFIIIQSYFFLTGIIQDKNGNISEEQGGSLIMLFIPAIIFDWILHQLSEFDFLIPFILFCAKLLLLYFFGREIINLGNALNWNWLDWAIFAPIALFCLVFMFYCITEADKKPGKVETDPNRLFE